MRLAEARDQYNCLVKSLDEKQRLFYLFQEVKALAAESCLTLRPHGLQPARPSVHGILQARILEWVAIPFFRGSS